MRSFSGVFLKRIFIALFSLSSLAVAFSDHFSAEVFRAFLCSSFLPALFVKMFFVRSFTDAFSVIFNLRVSSEHSFALVFCMLPFVKVFLCTLSQINFTWLF